VARASDNGREDGAGSVVTGEAGLAHAGAVVEHESLDLIISHFESFFFFGGGKVFLLCSGLCCLWVVLRLVAVCCLARIAPAPYRVSRIVSLVHDLRWRDLAKK
jgi:hypothetical protein